MKEKTTAIIIFVFISILIISPIIYIFYYNNPWYDKDCLIKTAKEVCESKDMIYDEVDGIRQIFCRSDERAVDGQKFNFLDSELKECTIKEVNSWEKNYDR